jgi:hypothetical protein
MTKRAEMCELSNTELDAVCGGALISGPLVVISGIGNGNGNLTNINSFNTNSASSLNSAIIAGNIASGINVTQLAATLGLQGIV